MSSFEDKIVLVAGASRGVGLVTAASFARQGATVVAADVSPEIDTVMERLEGVDNPEGFSARCDITDAQQCADVVQQAVDRYGRLDVLAVVAGVLQQAHPVAELPEEEWDRVLAVNVKGPLLMAKAALPHLREREAARIVNVASWWSYSGHAFFAAYCASKAALRMLTQSIAAEEAENGITANCVAPGNIDTEMHHTALRTEAEKRGVSYEELKKIEWDKIPVGHASDPQEIANAILFLASDEAGHVTGQSLDVNGGVLFR